VCPSRQTLDLACSSCAIALQSPRLIAPLLSAAARCIGALNNTLVASARAVRPLAAGEPQQARHRLLQHRRGLSVLRRPAYCRFGSEEGSKLARVQTRRLREEELGHQRQTTGGRSVMPRTCVSLALRSTAAPGCSGRAGTGFARAGSAGALGHGVTQREIQTGRAVSSPARSNPSVDGTHNGGARLLASATSAAPSCAPHVKR
jgi:hypothetical protein